VLWISREAAVRGVTVSESEVSAAAVSDVATAYWSARDGRLAGEHRIATRLLIVTVLRSGRLTWRATPCCTLLRRRRKQYWWWWRQRCQWRRLLITVAHQMYTWTANEKLLNLDDFSSRYNINEAFKFEANWQNCRRNIRPASSPLRDKSCFKYTRYTRNYTKQWFNRLLTEHAIGSLIYCKCLACRVCSMAAKFWQHGCGDLPSSPSLPHFP